MIYKIFSNKTATIYSQYPTLNTGLDEILSINSYTDIGGNKQVSRGLIQFDQNEINKIISQIGTSSFQGYLKLSLANASEIPLDYTLFCYPISQSWDMGTGRYNNKPITTNGVSWNYRDTNGDLNWNGGTWVTSSFTTQSFNYLSNKDIEFNLGNWFTGSNNGFIIKHSSNIEFSSSANIKLDYFTANTHTIFPPCLEIRWDNSVYSTGSLNLINSTDIVVSIRNNKGEFYQNETVIFDVNVRDKYPTRQFQTSSIYLNQKVLPSSSYYSIIDYKTNEIIYDFDSNYTKLSCSNSGNYFLLNCGGLQPGRYYKVLIKTIYNGETLIFDNNYNFKVI